MTATSITSDLIERLKKATEGSRELGDEVLLACGWLGQTQASQMAGILIPHWKSPDGHDVPTELRPNPTESIDAALTLVPENENGWMVEDVGGKSPRFTAQVGILPNCDANTAALALCIAALRARYRDGE